MSAIPLVPKGPLADEKFAIVLQWLNEMGEGQLQWLSGYAAGLAQRPRGEVEFSAVGSASTQKSLSPLTTVIYGTQTGNSRTLAERFCSKAEALGLPTRLFRADNYPTKALKDESRVVIVISTQGDGDPPEDARSFFDFLFSKRAPTLTNLHYGVLGLGDSSYPKFCHVAKQLDERLESLGAHSVLARTECDLDFEAHANQWIAAFLNAVKHESQRPDNVSSAVRASTLEVSRVTKKSPFEARLLTNQKITGRKALKDVRHLELSLEGSGLEYSPGDALGVWATNPTWLVEDLLNLTGLKGSDDATKDGITHSLQHWLTHELELTRPNPQFLSAHLRRSDAQKAGSPDTGMQIVDAVRSQKAQWTANEFVGALHRLAPRLYSISSSQRRFQDEVHLTVSVVDYVFEGRQHVGAASFFLSELEEGAKVRVFVEPNERFRLPKDSDTNVIMIGPGTGVAPFRAFLQEREETHAQGKQWLFFGEQHFSSQFLYQREWLDALKRKTLTKLDVAFSRDQRDKRYVQHVLKEKGAEVFAWLQAGASLYVCGDAKRMAKDVESALIEVAMTHGEMSSDNAMDWLAGLRKSRRYLRDVY